MKIRKSVLENWREARVYLKISKYMAFLAALTATLYWAVNGFNSPYLLYFALPLLIISIYSGLVVMRRPYEVGTLNLFSATFVWLWMGFGVVWWLIENSPNWNGLPGMLWPLLIPAALTVSALFAYSGYHNMVRE
jgi:hypothetical protein